MNIGHIIKMRRRSLGLTRDELAKRAGVGVRSVTHWESGGGMTVVSAIRVLDALGLTLKVTEKEHGQKRV